MLHQKTMNSYLVLSVVISYDRHYVKYRKFDLISWCGNFVERRSFRIVLGECDKLKEYQKHIQESVKH